MTSRAGAICLTVLIATTAPPVAAAQAGSAQVVGTIIDASSRSVVPGANVVHVGAGRTVVTDSLGRFVFAELPAGIVRFIVRSVGFPVVRVAVALTKGESLSKVIELDSSSAGRSAAQSLPAVALTAPRSPIPRFVDFERRRLTGRGQYLVREELEKSGVGSLQDAMRGLRGVNIDCGGGSGCNIRMARAPMRCSPQYIVDERVDNTFGPDTPIRDIEGIEVYTGPSDVPGEFAGRSAGCGVVVVWTRSGPSRSR
ncbi:hypothetical protein BH11GEM1_BH11GEM1_36880 [soil metagenome]